MANQRTKKITFLLVAALLVGLSFWFWQHPLHQTKLAEKRDQRQTTNQSNTPGQTTKAALSVEMTRPAIVQWPKTLEMNGSIFPWQEALVSAEITGLRIQQVLSDVGAQVSKGQPLILLADETVKADLQKQLATVEKDKAALAEAKSNADRAREIKDSGALSAQKINEYVIAEQTAKANLALSEAELENQRIRLRQTKVVAPDDGVISSRSANLGNVVSAGTELFRLVRQGRIEWRGEINADQQNALHAGQAVRLRLSGDKSVIGKVRLISPTVDSNTRNALVYVDIPKDSAKPGMYVQGQVDIGQQQGIAVPLGSVTYRDGFAYVFELTPADSRGLRKVIQRKVQTGRTRGELIELLSGVAAEASLVLSGGAFLNDGDTVSVVVLAKRGV
ncbi:efflux RND transporter periplasmic adaptor subunit [Methylophilus medardicus]|uniref:Efflux RND transporter periplasmic adaptor subunit n=1 Tax=Methylophilus medardicus TaxID=2588534 RepID=A0A5B8CPF6_9PROT|nr:efflux RND transporter periplasmic adaptor subunit [Methylophilus medardicus]QDC43132.1 efflux RND transporter periplasmic adaptor subunit [Methylophilus medardicus]QDC48139.1 efflux RND transporter periplasmic adaptor subunit [Methylophilus medardicus]QDC51844.1 efflux RND transporter periplasmic adaptor subunit [Methylophilus medardicus]